MHFSALRTEALVGLRDFISRREPNSILLLNMRDRLLEILDVQGLSRQERVKGNAHHSRELMTFGVKCLKLICDRFEIFIACIAMPCEKADVVKFHTVGN